MSMTLLALRKMLSNEKWLYVTKVESMGRVGTEWGFFGTMESRKASCEKPKTLENSAKNRTNNLLLMA